MIINDISENHLHFSSIFPVTIFKKPIISIFTKKNNGQAPFFFKKVFLQKKSFIKLPFKVNYLLTSKLYFHLFFNILNSP